MNCYYTRICILIYLHIPEYNLLSLYNAACMYAVRAGHLVCDNLLMWLMCISLLSAFLSCLCRLCRVESSWTFFCPPSASQWLSSLFSSCVDSHVSETLRVQLLTLLADTVSEESLPSSGSCDLSTPSSAVFPEGVFYRSVHWDWAPQLCILIGCGSVMVSTCCEETCLRWGLRTTLAYGYEDKRLDCF